MLPMSAMLASAKVPEKRDSFRSYVRFGGSDQQNGSHDDGDSEFASEDELRLLSDELVAAMCESVIYYPAFGDNRFGKIFCTNFRLCFVPLAEPIQDPCCSRSLILADKYEVPLCAIDEIQYCSVPLEPKHLDSKKFRPMTAPFSTLDIVSCLKIFAKDFRVFAVDFQNAQFAVSFCNQMFHFSRPNRLTTLFQLARFSPNVSVSSREFPLFNSKSDWESELSRCDVGDRMWRFTFFNSDRGQTYSPVTSYPECVVVPVDLYDHQLETMCASWNNFRFPVWCWSSRHGCAILRSADVSSVTMATEQMWETIINDVARAHPENQPPDVFDVTIVRSRISAAYSALRKLCSTDLLSSFQESDNRWYANVDETGWCQLVFQCLSHSLKVVESIVEKRRSVILKEVEGLDITAVVSSLAQLCLDPFFRTQNGFARLVQKEWCALGHPFGLRLFGASCTTSASLTDEMAPTFLLFLDCVSQLVHSYEIDFDFSQAMLVSIWDLATTGLTTSFSCNSLKELAMFGKRCDAFPLRRFYSAEHCRLFANPLHAARHLIDLMEPDSPSQMVLWPPSTAAQVRIWSECYLRWSPPTHTTNGGRVMVDVALSDLCVDVAALFNEQSRLQSVFDRQDHPLVMWRHERHPAATLEKITSGYPYMKEMRGVQSYAADSLSLSSARSNPSTPRPGAANRSFVQRNNSVLSVEPLSYSAGMGSTSPRTQSSPPTNNHPQVHHSRTESTSTLRSDDRQMPKEERYEKLRARPLPATPKSTLV